jgi:undecaprenyl-diphosphatase
MNIIQAIILGLVEGVTEFLPISSTFHLIWTSKLLAIPESDFLSFFEVFIQSGAILAVVIVYFKYILEHKQNIRNILFSFVPTAIVGLLLHKIIKTIFFNSDALMLSAFAIVGIVFIIVEYFIKHEKIKLTKSILEISLSSAVIIGLAQSIAVLPGVSRAGAVMICMMILGYKRKDAALYSFLLAVPTILAASAFDLVKLDFSILGQGVNLLLVCVGFVVAFLSAMVVIKWLIQFLQKNTLTSFGIYRLALSILIFLGLR